MSHSPDDGRGALRAALLERRRRQGEAEIARRSAAAAVVVLASELWRRASTIAAFVGVRGEPETLALLDDAWSTGKAIWLPRMRGGVIELVHTRARDQLARGGFGLIEPTDRDEPRRALAQLAPALVVVPGLGFGRDGARLGFGRGHYDRALAPLRDRSDVVRMGLCFATFLDPPEGRIPMAAHDVPMHAVATDEGMTLVSA